MAKSKCSGCRFWKYSSPDRLYGNPGFHYCINPQMGFTPCGRYPNPPSCRMIERNNEGFITDASMKEMMESLPIEMFVEGDPQPHRVISTKKELEAYLFGALPYVLTTRFKKVTPAK